MHLYTYKWFYNNSLKSGNILNCYKLQNLLSDFEEASDLSRFYVWMPLYACLKLIFPVINNYQCLCLCQSPDNSWQNKYTPLKKYSLQFWLVYEQWRLNISNTATGKCRTPKILYAMLCPLKMVFKHYHLNQYIFYQGLCLP